MPKAFPEEFRRDVVAVARKRETPLRQIADQQDGATNGTASSTHASAELWEARKRIKLLEQAAEVLRRAVAYLSWDINPE